MSVKYKLQSDLAFKSLLQEIAVMLVFVSLIYKQSILSFILFFILVWYTVQKMRHDNPLALVRYSVVVVILLQYILALSNLSSYNTPTPFPQQLTETFDGEGYPTYPSYQKYYYSIPWYFKSTPDTV
jgi:hypothetical protein